MRTVTQDAVFTCRRVFPKKRTTFLGVTVVAGLVDRKSLEAEFTDATVRIVTVAAAHFVFTQGVTDTAC